MDKFDEVKVNETHICILKKDNEKIAVDYIMLTFEFEDLFNEFKLMYENKNRNRLELENFVKNTPLKQLLKSFNFCYFLSSAYIESDEYKSLDYKEFLKNIETFKTTLSPNDLENKSLNLQLEEYHSEQKAIFFNEMLQRRIAFCLDKSYIECQKDAEILAFSHRRRGYSYPIFKLGNDFDVIFLSNFGYGNSSYFFTHIKYKGIDILTYSDWIRYRYVNTYEIIRFTRRNQLTHTSWAETMFFTAELYNNSVSEPESFVDKWIINECVEMVDGLEYLLNKNEDYEVINNYFNKDSKFTLNDTELLIYKGEKITGALSFFEKINELSYFSDKIGIFIQRISNCNLKIYPKLKKELLTLTKTLKEMEINFKYNIDSKWKDLKGRIENYEKFKTETANKLNKEKQTFRFSIYSEEVLIIFKRFFPFSDVTIVDFEIIDKKYNEMKRDLIITENLKMKFQNFVSIIEKHLASNKQ